MPVSVLDLEQYRLRGRTPGSSIRGRTGDTDVFSLNDVNVFVRLDDQIHTHGLDDPVMAIPDPDGRGMVGRGGLEPPTSRLSGVRSNHLSYRP